MPKLDIDSREVKVKKSLRYSVVDGTFYSVMVAFGENFFSAFAVFLNASSIQLGLIASLPQALGALFQLLFGRLIGFFKSRKKIVLVGGFLEGVMYIPIFLSFLFGAKSVDYLLFFICLYWIFRLMINPAWSSWMGDLVNPQHRGEYFGMRNKITGFSSFVALMLAGFLLELFNRDQNTVLIGFGVLFSVAVIARCFSIYYLSKKYEPPFSYRPSEQFSFIEFLRKARFNNYGMFVIFLCFMNFAVYLSAPFFTPYILRDLGMDYFQLTVITSVAVVTKFLAMDMWGKASDKYGTKKVLGFAAYLIPIVPILWIFSGNFWYLVAIQIFSGFAWAGFEICAFNFILDSTSSQKRATCVAYYNLLNGIGMIAGAIIGGVISTLPTFFWSQFYMVFFISFLARYVVAIFFVPKIREMRHVEKTSYQNLVLHMLPTHWTSDFIHKVSSIHFTDQKPKALKFDVKKK